MPRCKSHNQQEAKAFELSLGLVECLWDVHHFVVDNLVNLLKIAGPLEQDQVMGEGDFLKGR
jgi:hypothetical protein